ncbi:MAG: ATP-binding protein [Granulosicoccus sp.]
MLTISDKVSDQLLSICARNSTRAAVPLALAMFLTWLLLVNKVDNLLLNIWVCVTCLAILARVLVIRGIHSSVTFDGRRKRLLAALMTLTVGCAITSVLYFFPLVGLFERAMLTAILLGLCTVSYSTNIGYQPLLIAYIGPTLGTLATLWMINMHDLVHTPLAMAVGLSVLIVAITMLRNGKFMFEAFSLAIESSSKLEQQSRHLSVALTNAERAKQAAETSSESKTRFIAAASHDLRQPVHVLNLFGGALNHAPLDKSTRDIVDNMNIAVNSLSSQLNSLLDMSELDAGNVQPNFQAVNLHDICSRLTGELVKLAEDKQIRLVNQVPEAVFVHTDPVMLLQIIRNLCGNAIKYTEQGSVTLLAECLEDRVTLLIKDTGVGIDSEDCSKVFEEFYQASNPSRDKSQGLGLGLSIVERLIRALGHQISLQSLKGEGTTVHVDMPLYTLDSSHLIEESEDEIHTSITRLPQGTWVHIVDDDPAVLNSVKAFLLPLGCKVTGNDNPEDALEFLENNTPSAVLIDLRMQDEESGLRVIDELKRKQSAIPVALITGESLADGTIVNAYPDLLMQQKPVSNDTLLGLLSYLVSDDADDSELDDTRDFAGENADEVTQRPDTVTS